jgi:sigma-B regulation protein RsbU (phosphoserine phosphatase)
MGEDLLVGDVSQDKHYINARNETRSEMVALLRRGQRIVGAFNVESDLLNAYTRSDLMLLKAFASQAAVAVDNATLYEDAVEKRRLENELSLARSIQKRLLPSTAPHIDGWEIAGLNVPAARVGGDYYDFIDVSDGVTGISIADVSGKGVPAALVMATFRASLLAEILNEYSIETIFDKVNELLVRSTEPPVFVTAIYGTLETTKGMFTYCNAGHLPPLLIPAHGDPRELTGSDLLLGSFSNAEYYQRIIDLGSGDILILYTDGVSEAMGRQGEEFGTERLAKIAAAHKAGPAVEIRDRLYAEAVEFAADPTVLDDMTAVVIKRL